ncbi:chromosome segregation protein SMC [Nesterenkonia xinjiangensis]|uniref:Chromosome partition protein Smc n=3 Tax=Nesterenkonia xinjiangensis TaxID=225327 RepID=A0A7Z0GR38_9MICC|nr:chromosome segregation protein SMC [Nesterenkonia xinjiangensis]NYJ79726.1 chromosome segregation protein [Nesterenkonia xinjiangensis]
MHLKTLTIRGFKSFASATTFEFEPGVTAVVGPNGSGKSNVVDALAWVMGEQGAKSLRGGSMEDVIFAGTTDRQPLGRASVSLTIDNSDGALPIEYSEVTISRTMFRTGGSEYTINGQKCRLLDIQELLSDSGLGREMHVIVGQGQLDQILQATPEQRRGFIEEAAGVLKHRRRRERTVRKLESMQGNLDRLEDLISEISRQLAPLGRQAKVARRAQRIQHDVRDSLSRLIADDLIQAATALHESGRGEEEDRSRAEELRASLQGQDRRITAREEQSRAQRLRGEKLLAGHHRLAQAQERLRSVASVAAERSRSLYASATVEDSGRDPEQLRVQAQQVAEEAQTQQTEVEQSRTRLEETSERRSASEEALKAEETRLTEQLRAVADRRAGLATLRGRVDAAQGRIEAAEARRRRAEEQREQARQVRESSRAQFADLEQRIAGIETGEEDLDAAYEKAQARYDGLKGRYDELLAERRRLEAAVNEYRARLSGLSAARTPRDGAAALRREWEQLIPLADRLTVTGGWEKALAACLGSLDTALVAADAEQAAQALARLAEADEGRAHLIYPTQETADSPSAGDLTARLPEGVLSAGAAISGPAELSAPLSHALDGVVLCRDLDSARKALALSGVRTAVTASGDVLRRGEHIGGTALENSDVAITAQITELTETLRQTERDLAEVQAAAETQAGDARAAELAAEESLEALHANDAEMTATTEQLGRLSSEVSRAEERIAAAETEIAEVAQARQHAQEQLDEASARLAAAESDDVEEEPSAEERDRLSEQASADRREEVEARLALRAAEEQHHQLQERAAGLRRSAQAEETRREQARRVAEARSSRAQQAEAVQAEAEQAVERISTVLQEAQDAHDDAQHRHRDLAAEIQRLRQERQAEAEDLDSVTSRLHQAELTRTELRVSLEAAEQRGHEELSLSPEYLIENYGPDQPIPDPEDENAEARPYDRAEQQTRLDRARRDLKALGNVNPLALEEHAALEERHSYLQEQLADLKGSRQDLLEIISDVDQTVERVFTEAWVDTKAQFERVFARLFPGGEGHLELTNPEDMLNTGIEVHARPPGKRIRRLSLLSGGERSLTAVALLVAIFKARPSPFYVMDEVEAALDDTNLSRLLVIFEELRASSQLIVITHQKRTMEIADALYGVSMRQDGSTRVVSQRLARADEDRATESQPAV